MKVLKFLLILIGIILGVGIIAGLVLPKTWSVERSVEIDAPNDVIFAQIANLKNHNAWSPWEELDPNMKHTYEGTDGTVGFISKWEGNKEVGKGEQEIKAIKVNERVDFELRFVEPMEDVAQVYLTMADGENGTKVSWGMNGKAPFPGNVFMALMGVTKTISGQYDKGLSMLKDICLEAAKKPTPKKYKIQTIDLPELTYVGIRKELNMKDLQPFLAEHYGAMVGALTKKKMEMAGMPSALYFTFDEETMDSDMAAVLPVSKEVDLGKPYSTFKFPASKALRVDYYGDYNGLGVAHETIEAYIKANNLTAKTPCIEEYASDPIEGSDPSTWLTKVTYFLDDKGE